MERLWRTVKYEDVYLRGYGSPKELREGLKNYFRFFNEKRPHQSLGNKSPLDYHRMKGHRWYGRLAPDISPRNPTARLGSRGENHAWVTGNKYIPRVIYEAKKRQKTVQWLGSTVEVIG